MPPITIPCVLSPELVMYILKLVVNDEIYLDVPKSNPDCEHFSTVELDIGVILLLILLTGMLRGES